MTATDELRRMLDERGVEWCPSAWDRSTETYWKTADGNGCLATQGETKLRLSFADYLTPEQAIEATLGRGTCSNLAGQDEDGEWGFRCSECGAMPKYGSGEVHVPSSGELPDGTVWLGDSWLPWAWCPCCGRKVVGE